MTASHSDIYEMKQKRREAERNLAGMTWIGMTHEMKRSSAMHDSQCIDSVCKHLRQFDQQVETLNGIS